MSDAHREHYAWMKDTVKHTLLTLGSFIMRPACKEVVTTKTLGSNVSDNMDQTATYHSLIKGTRQHNLLMFQVLWHWPHNKYDYEDKVMHLTRAEFYSFIFPEPSSAVSILHTVHAQVNIFEFNFMCEIARYTTELESIMLCCLSLERNASGNSQPSASLRHTYDHTVV